MTCLSLSSFSPHSFSFLFLLSIFRSIDFYTILSLISNSTASSPLLCAFLPIYLSRLCCLFVSPSFSSLIFLATFLLLYSIWSSLLHNFSRVRFLPSRSVSVSISSLLLHSSSFISHSLSISISLASLPSSSQSHFPLFFIWSLSFSFICLPPLTFLNLKINSYFTQLRASTTPI